MRRRRSSSAKGSPPGASATCRTTWTRCTPGFGSGAIPRSRTAAAASRFVCSTRANVPPPSIGGRAPAREAAAGAGASRRAAGPRPDRTALPSLLSGAAVAVDRSGPGRGGPRRRHRGRALRAGRRRVLPRGLARPAHPGRVRAAHRGRSAAPRVHRLRRVRACEPDPRRVGGGARRAERDRGALLSRVGRRRRRAARLSRPPRVHRGDASRAPRGDPPAPRGGTAAPSRSSPATRPGTSSRPGPSGPCGGRFARRSWPPGDRAPATAIRPARTAAGWWRSFASRSSCRRWGRAIRCPSSGWNGPSRHISRRARSPSPVQPHRNACERRLRARIAAHHQGIVSRNDVLGRLGEAPEPVESVHHLLHVEHDGEGRTPSMFS